ncbi:MAG: hypothetical protein GF411_19185 [Candidatus Lokiarchaeota archaeon]|nr:hypothetical protein [Candidatus Lokiarchaeota archaeon]
MIERIVAYLAIILDFGPQKISALGSNQSREYSLLFWEELKQLLGPIFGPIFEPIIVPILDALSNDSYRLLFVDTLVWTLVIISILTFLAYEWPIISGIFAPSKPRRKPPPSTTTVTATSAQREYRSRKSRRIPRDKVELQPVRREMEGVSIKAKMDRQGDYYTLKIQIHNGADFPMKMSLVELVVPVGIDTAVGTLRMQRLGEIDIGDSRSCEFKLITRGGDIEELEGYVEFMSDSYESARIPIPNLFQEKSA